MSVSSVSTLRPAAGSDVAPRRYRILLISNFFPPHVKGGAELACAHLAAWLARQGHAVAVMTLAPPGAADTIEDSPQGFRVFRRRIPNVYHTYLHDRAASWKKPLWHLIDHFNPFSARALSSVLEDFAPEVVNTHNLQGMGYNLWSILGKRGLPLVVTLHDPALVCIRSSMFKDGLSCGRLCRPCGYSHRLKNAYLSRVGRLSFASPSRALLSLLGSYFPPNTNQAQHVPNPLSFRTPHPAQRVEGGIELLYVGQISAHKGVEFIMEVLDAPGMGDKFRLTLLGRGPLLESLKSRFASRKWVRFEGFVPPEKVADYMAASDVLLIPSLWVENAPLVAMEAIGLGLPMITSLRGGLPELVSHDVTGLALEAGDRQIWMEALSKLAADRHIIEEWKRNAQERRKEFDVDLLGNRYLSLIEATITQRPSRATGSEP